MVIPSSPSAALRLVWLAALLASVSCKSFSDPFDDGKQWGEPKRVQEAGASIMRVDLAIGPTGDVTAVWDQPAGNTISSRDVWSNRMGDNGDWGVEAPIENREPNESTRPRIGTDRQGNATVLFLQSDGTHISVWSVRNSSVDGWDPESVRCIQSDSEDLTCTASAVDSWRLDLAVKQGGSAVAVWQQFDEVENSIRIGSNRFTPESGWGDASVVDPDTRFFSESPQITMDENGNAVVVWARFDGDRFSIFSKRQTPTGAWEGTAQVELDDGGDALDPDVASEAEGNAVVVWRQQASNEATFDIWANRLGTTTPPNATLAERIDTDLPGDSLKPRLAMDRDGNAFAVWARSTGAASEIWANRYRADAGWGAAQRIGPRGLPARDPRIAASPDGDAVAVWIQFDGDDDATWANRYLRGAGWGTSQPIEPSDARTASTAWVAIDAKGRAVAVWSTFGNAEDPISGEILWSNRLE